MKMIIIWMGKGQLYKPSVAGKMAGYFEERRFV